MAAEVKSEPERETIDLDTWHEVCRRRDAGQPLEIPQEPIERRPIHTETVGQILRRDMEKQIHWQLRMLPYALALLAVLGLLLFFVVLVL